MADHLEDEARRTTDLLAGKTVGRVWRHRPSEVAVEFTYGTRLFVDVSRDGVELSITDGPD